MEDQSFVQAACYRFVNPELKTPTDKDVEDYPPLIFITDKSFEKNPIFLYAVQFAADNSLDFAQLSLDIFKRQKSYYEDVIGESLTDSEIIEQGEKWNIAISNFEEYVLEEGGLSTYDLPRLDIPALLSYTNYKPIKVRIDETNKKLGLLREFVRTIKRYLFDAETYASRNLTPELRDSYNKSVVDRIQISDPIALSRFNPEKNYQKSKAQILRQYNNTLRLLNTWISAKRENFELKGDAYDYFVQLTNDMETQRVRYVAFG